MQVVLVYLERFRRNSVLKCVLQPKIAKNSLKTPIFGGQVRSRSSMLVPLESSSAVLVMISSKSVSICSLSHARWANSGKITISKGVPLFDVLVQGESPRPAAPKLPLWKLETLGYHMVKTRSLCLTRMCLHRVVTDGRTDRIAIANTRLSSTWRYSCGA